MSQNNNKDSSGAAAIGFLLAGVYILAAVLFFLAVFLAFIYSIICVIACFRPLRIGKSTLYPHEAKAILNCGIAGAFLLPAFCVFVELFFKINFNPAYLPHIVAGGYTLGLFSMQYVTEQQAEAERTRTLDLPSQRIDTPPPVSPPFRFASWKDEDGR